MKKEIRFMKKNEKYCINIAKGVWQYKNKTIEIDDAGLFGVDFTGKKSIAYFDTIREAMHFIDEVDFDKLNKCLNQ